MSVTVKPAFTQRLLMHLNGGRSWSGLSYDIFRDGKETGIQRHKRTNGLPEYLVTSDVFVCGDDRFDVLETKGNGLQDWLESHSC